MRVSKNIEKGKEITDLRVLLHLAKERRSVVVTRVHTYVRPAAWVISWPLREILNYRFYYAVKDTKNNAPQNNK